MEAEEPIDTLAAEECLCTGLLRGLVMLHSPSRLSFWVLFRVVGIDASSTKVIGSDFIEYRPACEAMDLIDCSKPMIP